MLPVVGALLMANIAIGVITRSSPQLNMFSFAFPVTLLLAFFILYLSTRTIGNAFADLTKNALESVENSVCRKKNKMAENQDQAQEKTQDPTSRRIEKAREDGKVVTSRKCRFSLF